MYIQLIVYWHVYFYCLSPTVNYVFVITVIGIPIVSLDNCSEFQARFTCIVHELTTLRWDIYFINDFMINGVSFYQNDNIGRHFRPKNVGTDVAYHFNLTSTSPLTSTMTTDTPTDLSEAIVSCSDGSPDSTMALLSNTELICMVM